MTNILARFRNKKVYVISPHLDDAVLSCSQLLSALSAQVPVTVINVFTTAHSGPYTLSARKYMRLCQNSSDAKNLFSQRRLEDQQVLKKLGTKIINLGFSDALFRRKSTPTILGRFLPELDHLYPIFRWQIIADKISSDPVQLQIQNKLSKLIPRGSVVLAPLNIARHIDHQLVKTVSRELFPQTIFYSEFPYNINNTNISSLPGFDRVEIKSKPEVSDPLIRGYTSQFTSLFPDGIIPAHPEIYFFPKI